MKEASGELSMTAITVVAIAAIASVFSIIVLPRIKAALKTQTQCMSKFNCDSCNNGTASCNVLDDDGKVLQNKVSCPCDSDGSTGTNTGTGK